VRSRNDFLDVLSGPVPSISTPFTRDGAIDEAALRRIVDFLVDAGARALMLTYGDSLYSVLTDDEVAEVTRIVAGQAAGRAAVIAADRIWATPKAVDFAKYCRETGVDLLMVLPPHWERSCTLDGLVAHYAAVAREVPVMLVTNYLSDYSEAFGIRLAERLRDEVPGVVAVKDDICGGFMRKLCLALCPAMPVLSGGQKQNHLDAVPYGCQGYLTTYGRFNPAVARRYWAAIERADLAGAAEVVQRFDMPLFDYLLQLEGGFDAGVHGLLELAGIAPRWRRSPYHSLTDAQLDALAAFVDDHGMR
jgi:dihydrodipicolinate synthase/N-acetylneuraminate lyase